jgi:predicted lipoprotein with Yx(FWY)xxD motif
MSLFRFHARIAATIALAMASFASAALASPSVGVTTNPQAGDILVDDQGITLYRFTPDTPNTSTCYEGCARAWPPVLVDSVPTVQDSGLASGLGIAARTDGTQQLTYQGMPLYYFVGDHQSGDTNGQGIDDEWFVVNPTPAS